MAVAAGKKSEKAGMDHEDCIDLQGQSGRLGDDDEEEVILANRAHRFTFRIC